MASKYPHVFKPLVIRNVLFKNRIEQAPPGCFFSGDDNGFVTKEFVSYFRQYARGGAAICNVGNCTIDVTESSDEARQLQLDSPDCVQPMKYFAEMCQSYGAHGSMELTHNGKDTPYENINHAPYSASAFITPAERNRAARAGREPIPTIEMSIKHIKETVEKFARAALYCKQAGMKMVMIHGAHGNLIAQFASHYYNKRTDEYGGSPENRARFAVEVIDAIRAAVGEEFVLEYRISAEEFHPEMMHLDETIEFIGFIKDKIDILHVSAGIHDVHGEPYWMRHLMPNYAMSRMPNVKFSAAIKKVYPDLITSVVGSIKDIAQAEEIIASGASDFVAMNRALHADYDMPRKYAEGREWEHMPCLRCTCFRMASPHTTKLCSVNAIWGRFDEYPDGRLPVAAERKKVAVIGGGPGGIESVKWLLQRGHDVTLYEKSGEIGGRLRDAVAAPFKEDLRDYLQYMRDFAANCGAQILLNTEATPELLREQGYDHIIAAVGSDPKLLDIPGSSVGNVMWAVDAEHAPDSVGDELIIIGGASVAVEVAINLAMQGKRVTTVARSTSEMIRGAGAATPDLIAMMKEHGVNRMLGWRPVEVTADGLIVENVETGERRKLCADAVLMGVGMAPRRDEALRFHDCCPPTNFHIIGDAVESGDVRDAVWSAFEAARYI